MREVKVAAEQRLNDSGTAADEQELHIQAVFLIEIFLLLHPDGQMVPGGPRVAGAEFGLCLSDCRNYDQDAK